MTQTSETLQRIEPYKKLIILTVAALIIYSYGPGLLSSVIPGPEGIRASNIGVEIAHSGVVRAGTLSPLPTGYTWGDNQPSNMGLKHLKQPGEPWGGFQLNGPEWWYHNDAGEVKSEVQRPTLTDPFNPGNRRLTYYKYEKINATAVTIRKYVVDLVPADFTIQLYATPRGGLYTFHDTQLWYALDTVTWTNAYTTTPPPDPNPLTNSTVKYQSSSYRGAFPITAWIGEYQSWVWHKEDGGGYSNPPTPDAEGFASLSPSLEGRYIDLFTEPESKYDLLLTSEVAGNPTLLEAALAPGYFPDPRFAETVYFSITANSFGGYVQPTGILGSYSSYTAWYPSASYRVRVLYAVTGEYVYLWTTDAADEAGYGDWEIHEPTHETSTDPITWLATTISSWFTNISPASWAGLGIWSLALILGVTALLLHWYTTWTGRRS